MLSRVTREVASWRARQAETAFEQIAIERELKLWESVLRGKPQHAAALRRAAELFAQKGNAERAQELWTRCLARPELEPRAHGELARLAFERRDLDLAREHADRFLERTEPEHRAFSLRRYVESLRVHLEVPETPSPHHQVCVTGVAFSGSTLFGHLLSQLPGVSNIGESHRLIHHRVDLESIDIDFDATDLPNVHYCNRCGKDCPIWTWKRRREFHEDRRDWYLRIAQELGVTTLISTDKNQWKQLTLDPWLRFDVIVLYRHPRHAWQSAAKPGRKPRTLDAYLRRWDEHYRKLSFDLRNQGQKLFVDLDRFREDPDRHLEQVRELLELPSRESGEPDTPSHSVGGNGRVVRAFKTQAEVRVDREQGGTLTDEEEIRIAEYVRGSSIYRHLRQQHEIAFSKDSPARG